jgi:FkbM family methyltransferase
MTLANVLRAMRHRWVALCSYAVSAPSIEALPRWLLLGALRARLFGGEGRRSSGADGQPVDSCIPIGRNDGEYIIVDTASFAELDVLQEVLVDRIYPLERIGFVPAMVLDCGANVGYFASLCRLRFPKAEIVCWEPDPHNFSRLVLQPMLRGAAVKCHQAAVSDADGVVALTGSGTGCRVTEPGTEGSQSVKAIDLAAWIKQNGVFPLLIKMDIEGHEDRVIGALRDTWSKPCVLFLETHADGGNDSQLLQTLSAVGFRMKLLRSHGLSGDRRIFNEYVGSLG